MEEIKSFFANVLNWLLIIGAIFIFSGMVCYFFNITFNFVIIGFFLVGIWSLNFLVTKFKFFDVKNQAQSIISSVVWYACAYFVISGTVYIFGSETVLGMYNNWADFDRSFWGFIRIFMPIFVITVGSIAIAITSENRNWSKNLIILCTILSIFGLLLHGLVAPADKWVSILKKEKAEWFIQNKLNKEGNLGLCVIAQKEEVSVYEEKIKNNKYEKKGFIKNGKKYPIYNSMNDIRKDGPQRLIQIYLPDKDGDFNSSSDSAWVRLIDVKIVPKVEKKIKKKDNGYKNNNLKSFIPFEIKEEGKLGFLIEPYNKFKNFILVDSKYSYHIEVDNFCDEFDMFYRNEQKREYREGGKLNISDCSGAFWFENKSDHPFSVYVVTKLK